VVGTCWLTQEDKAQWKRRVVICDRRSRKIDDGGSCSGSKSNKKEKYYWSMSFKMVYSVQGNALKKKL
jgi:hypothetical protein